MSHHHHHHPSELLDESFDKIMKKTRQLKEKEYSEMNLNSIIASSKLTEIVRDENTKITPQQDKSTVKANFVVRCIASLMFIFMPLSMLFSLIFSDGTDVLGATPHDTVAVRALTTEDIFPLAAAAIFIAAGIFLLIQGYGKYKRGMKAIEEGYKVYFIPSCSISEFKRNISYYYNLKIMSEDLERSDGIYVITRMYRRILVVNKYDCE